MVTRRETSRAGDGMRHGLRTPWAAVAAWMRNRRSRRRRSRSGPRWPLFPRRPKDLLIRMTVAEGEGGPHLCHWGVGPMEASRVRASYAINGIPSTTYRVRVPCGRFALCDLLNRHGMALLDPIPSGYLHWEASTKPPASSPPPPSNVDDLGWEELMEGWRKAGLEPYPNELPPTEPVPMRHTSRSIPTPAAAKPRMRRPK